MYTYNAKVIRVVDGDTFDALVDLGFDVFRKVRFRVYGVDTPEITGPEKIEGLRVKEIVRSHIEGEVVVIKSLNYDKYGRTVAQVSYCGGLDLATSLLEQNLAKPTDPNGYTQP